MKIHDKEVGFLYTVGAYCDYNDYVVANPQISVATANLHKAEIMSREYAKINPDSEPVTIDDLRGLMVYDLKDILEAVKVAEKAGTERKVETVDTGKKREKSN